MSSQYTVQNLISDVDDVLAPCSCLRHRCLLVPPNDVQILLGRCNSRAFFAVIYVFCFLRAKVGVQLMVEFRECSVV